MNVVRCLLTVTIIAGVLFPASGLLAMQQAARQSGAIVRLENAILRNKPDAVVGMAVKIFASDDCSIKEEAHKKIEDYLSHVTDEARKQTLQNIIQQHVDGDKGQAQKLQAAPQSEPVSDQTVEPGQYAQQQSPVALIEQGSWNKKYAVASIVLIAAALGVYFWFFKK